MRKTIITTAIMLILSSMSLIGLAQNPVERNDFDTMPRHEVRVNLLAGILRLNPDVSYEYLINGDLSVGGRFSFLLKENDEDLATGKISLAPYVRWNFYRNLRERGTSAKGFFVELSTPLSYYNNTVEGVRYPYAGVYDGMMQSEKRDGIGFGIALAGGYKYISPRNWTVEGFMMGGRNFTAPSGCEYLAGFGLSIGKKF